MHALRFRVHTEHCQSALLIGLFSETILTDRLCDTASHRQCETVLQVASVIKHPIEHVGFMQQGRASPDRTLWSKLPSTLKRKEPLEAHPSKAARICRFSRITLYD